MTPKESTVSHQSLATVPPFSSAAVELHQKTTPISRPIFITGWGNFRYNTTPYNSEYRGIHETPTGNIEISVGYET